MSLLPPRPLRLDERALRVRRLKKLALNAFVLAVGLAFCGGAVWFTRELLAERALWDRGTEGRVLQLSGKVQEHGKLGLTFFYDYQLDVRWADVQGQEHVGKTSFTRMFKAVPDRDPGLALRYDPSAPDQFVLSWAAKGGLARDGMPMMCAALGLLMLLGTVAMVRGERHRSETLRICAEDGEEFLCRVEKMWEYKRSHHVHYRLPDDGRLRKYVGDRPLVLVRDGVRHVLALRSPRAPDAPFLVDADLSSFELSRDERTRIFDALR